MAFPARPLGRAHGGRAARGQIARRAGLSLAVAAGLAWLLSQRLAGLDGALVWAALGAVPATAWAGALAATGVSFWAIGHYDAVIHRMLGTGYAGREARRAGLAAVAVSQTLGLGLITGALVRWRMLPDLGLWQATRVTMAVTASFLAAWAVITAGVLTALPLAPFKPLALAGLTLFAAAALLATVLPRRFGRALPPPGAMLRLVVLTAVDTLAAGVALWVLMPDGISAAVLLPVFLIAFGAGLVSGSPAGVGAFELALLALLPPGQDAAVLAAVLAWRVVYYAVPALLAAPLLLRGGTALVPRPLPDLRHSFAEAQLLRQGLLAALPAGGGHLMTGRTGHTLVALRDPLGRVTAAEAIAALRAGAATARCVPVLYKCSARMAVEARAAGFRTARVAQEAWLCPATFGLDLPARAGLRRKLRKAAAAGVQVLASHDLPLPAMAAVNAAWARARGGEHGFSMGRFEPAYLAGQQVFLAWRNGRLAGFASFHATADEWALDLLRPAPDAPDGTAHALIAGAIAEARLQGVARLSLAAAPAGALGGVPALPGWASRLAITLACGRFAGPDALGHGLAQFKQSFAPQWQPLYMAAPHRLGLARAALQIARAIHRPGPLPARPDPAPRTDPSLRPALTGRQTRAAPEYEFASARSPWHRRP